MYRLAHARALQRYPDPFCPGRTSNRWNSVNVQVAYTSDSVALAALEMLTYWGRYTTLSGYRLYSYMLGSADVLDLEQDHPSLDPREREQTQRYGNDWANNLRSLALKVPSVVVPHSYNYIIQPSHPSFDPTGVEDHGEFEYDDRILDLVYEAKN